MTREEITIFLNALNRFEDCQVFFNEATSGIEVYVKDGASAPLLLWELRKGSAETYVDHFGTGVSELAYAPWDVPPQAILWKENATGDGIERVVDVTDAKAWRTANKVDITTPVSYSEIKSNEYYREALNDALV